MLRIGLPSLVACLASTGGAAALMPTPASALRTRTCLTPRTPSPCAQQGGYGYGQQQGYAAPPQQQDYNGYGGDYGYNGQQQQQQQQQGYYPQQGGYDDYYPQQDGDYGYGNAPPQQNGYYNDQQQDQYGYGQQQYGGAPPPRKEYSYDFYMAQDNIRAQYDRYRAQGGLLEYLRWQEMVSPAVPNRWRQRPGDHINDPSRRYQRAPGRYGYD